LQGSSYVEQVCRLLPDRMVFLNCMRTTPAEYLIHPTLNVIGAVPVHGSWSALSMVLLGTQEHILRPKRGQLLAQHV
jgi:hypothetical protein